MTSTILLNVVFIGYIVYVLVREKKIPQSISHTWYGHGMKGDILFTLFCFAMGFILMSFANKTPFFVFSGVGMLFVGAAAMSQTKGIVRSIHFGGALLAILSAFMGLYYEFDTYLGAALWVSFTAYAYLFNIPNTVWWVEIVAFLLISYNLIVKFFM